MANFASQSAEMRASGEESRKQANKTFNGAAAL
jgi:hypothetical protein